MVSSILLPDALSIYLFRECSPMSLWPITWGAGPKWRPIGYVWYAKGAKRWLTTLQCDGGYFVVRCAHGKETAIMYVENRVVLRLDFTAGDAGDGEV